MPTRSSPIACSTRATLSPGAGVGASDRSTMPNGTPSFSDAARPTSSPMRVILNAVRLMTLASAPKSAFGSASTAFATTPGPLTPTLMTQSGSPMPWNAPAMNGLSSTALQNTTSFAQPMPSRSAVRCAVATTISPMRATASMLMPARVVATLTEAQTRSVTRERFGDRRDQRLVAGRRALVHERREAAEEVDADRRRPRARGIPRTARSRRSPPPRRRARSASRRRAC